VLRCEVDGRPRDPNQEWTRLAMLPVKRAAFDFGTADSAHAKKWRPNDPKADPTKPINILKVPSIPNPRRKPTT
jgi:hypothetical protein